MKRRSTVDDTALARLCDVLARLDGSEAVQSFLEDLCTPAELEALSDRWCVVPLLAEGVSYRQIHERTGVSVTTIGRVARHLEGGAGGYRAALSVRSAAAGGEPEHLAR
ncbi:YerC/YecD family TrpR-related protein [Ornithinimicrobium pekingense]|uniref:DNA-binding transcriptional regulator n=1 Tax=Ornithinimicrobium pekingense TaxID=384677 RepID=A0ABQ2FA15_9MICO|nr:YerC/YecD family TrpR-related protein [Ornithinimicrobium pekingense]GGK76287.1 DNA-binding transcriptional regulator [Ornithinimicrobium pekingense]